MHAWWMDDGSSGKTYRIEIPDAIVATIFTDYHTWSVDN